MVLLRKAANAVVALRVALGSISAEMSATQTLITRGPKALRLVNVSVGTNKVDSYVYGQNDS